MAQNAFILILSSDKTQGEALRDLLREEYGHACLVVYKLEEALDSIRARTPDVVITPTILHGAQAARPLAELLESRAPDATLLTVGDGDRVPPAKQIRVTVLPDDDGDVARLVAPIHEAAGKAVGRRDDRLLQQSIDRTEIEEFEGIVGTSPQIKRIIDRIKKAARNKLTVLILGETGTGKDLIARAIHRRSDRARKPFKSLNCAGLSESLIESELFGHVKGSFTGATADRKGYFAAADGGSLFLDEIGDMPFAMQAKLLRVLENREFTPVGTTEVRRVDVRLLAATNSDLNEKVQEKKFREDLFYRLNQWVISVPPLRERREDIPLLAQHLLRLANDEHGLSVEGFSSDTMKLLARFYWPGNVRDLRNVIESTACEVENRRIEADDLPERLTSSREIIPATSGLIGLSMAKVERIMIERTLQATGGNREQAAKMLGIGTRTLYRKIKEYGLEL